MNQSILRSYIRENVTMPHFDEKKNTPGINVNLLFMLLKPKDDGLFDMVIGVCSISVFTDIYVTITKAFGLPKPSLFWNVQRDVTSLPSYSKLNSNCNCWNSHVLPCLLLIGSCQSCAYELFTGCKRNIYIA